MCYVVVSVMIERRCVVVVSVMIEDKKPIKIEKSEVVDETDLVRRGYVRKTRSRAWTNKGKTFLSNYIISLVFSARQHTERAICCRPSVCLSVRPSHGWISRKLLNLGSCNFHHTVAPSLCFLLYKFHPEIPTGSPERGRQTMVGCGLAGNNLFS